SSRGARFHGCTTSWRRRRLAAPHRDSSSSAVPAPPPSASPRYAEIEASPALARWVSCYWTITAAAADTAVRVVPDASADIIFDLASGARPTAVGTMREAAV